LPEIQKAALLDGDYTVGLVFSTKYEPPHGILSLGARNEAWDTRFFDFHRDLDAETIAHLLGGSIFWRGEQQGEWVAVLHFNRAQVANSGVRTRPPQRGPEIGPESRPERGLPVASRAQDGPAL
jgi:hypothetical protein